MLAEFARIITAVGLLGEVTEIKNRIGSGESSTSTTDFVVPNGQDHRDGETARGHHALLPGIQPGVPARVIRRIVIGIRNVATDDAKVWFLPGGLLQQ